MSKRSKVRIALMAAAVALSWFSHAAETDWIMKPMEADLDDTASLQRGVNLYMNFCLGCHSLEYQRYERTADDLGLIPHDLAVSNLIFTDQKIGETIKTSMSSEDAKAWFGATPPDLTMVTRVRSPEWVYNFLLTFYEDSSRPFGANNKVFKDVGMPHVLLPLQGVQQAVCEGSRPIDILKVQSLVEQGRIDTVKDGGPENCHRLELEEGTGLYSAEEMDQAAFDIANFLHYVGDPTRQEREALGAYVLAFLVVLLGLAYFLNRNFWTDVKKS